MGNDESDAPTCQYLGDEEMGIDTEITENGGVGCVAEATTVIRPAGGSLRDIASPVGNVKVCWQHSKWLTSDETERAWERCGDLKTGPDNE